ncbi:hypothetical protein [Rubellicoccus peritrichatus]|uniref:Lipoprotein n=1 Tax=Rubellicoccus peritrichatus TaxID=3080537 RepID=A0AAQ3QWX9_9BACT|nr:hypothetical protein [Puniceicoccus sp. CR14]WOO42315.1 hypothetical protein RZN69_04380 [Puniceicoccus sp. CR14]
MNLSIRPFCALFSIFALLLGGCSLGHQKGSVVPGTAITSSSGVNTSTGGPTFQVNGEYYVERLPADGRGINRQIVDALRKRGLKAATGEAGQLPVGTDVVVTYQDRWMWDYTMYMIRLNIQLKTVDGELLASGESYRTGMIRKPPEFMIDEILNEIFEEVDPALVVPQEEPEKKALRKKKSGKNEINDDYRF